METNGQTIIEEQPAKTWKTRKKRSYKSELQLSEARERKWKLTAIAASSLALMEAVVYWVIELMK